MSRDVTAQYITELEGTEVELIYFVKFQLAAGSYIFMWTGVGDIEWNGETWQGVGNLLNIEFPQENTEMDIQGVIVSLNGVNSSILSAALQSFTHKNTIEIWQGFLDTNGAIIADPYLTFRGKVDVPHIKMGTGSATVTVAGENELLTLNKELERRWNSETQAEFINRLTDGQILTDKGFDMVEALDNWTGNWGAGEALPARRRYTYSGGGARDPRIPNW